MANDECTLAEESMRMARLYAEHKFRNRLNREDMIDDAVSYAWELARKGKGQPTTIAHYAVLRAGSRRGPATHASTRSIDSYGGVGNTAEREQLDAERRTTRFPNPAHAAAIRIDFGAWLESLNPRQTAVALVLSAGYTTSEAAVILKVSMARISMYRQELKASWFHFTADRE